MKKVIMKAIVFLALGLVACGGTSPESLVATDKGASEVIPTAPEASAAPNSDSGASMVDAGVGDAGNVQSDSGAIVSDAGADSGLPSCVQNKPVGACVYNELPLCKEFYQYMVNNTTPQYFCGSSTTTYYEGKGCAELMDTKRPIAKCYSASNVICSAMYFYSDVYNTCNGVRY